MSTALAIPQGFDPHTILAVEKLANAVASSALIPSDLRGKPGDVLIIMLTGHELGLPPMLALQKVYVIKGRPFIGSELLAAKVQSSPACLYFTLVESSERKATYETHRKGSPKPVQMSYTIEEANKAGLTGKDNWKNHAAAMLRARAAAALARAVYPDLIMGFDSMSEEELNDERFAVARNVTPAPVAKRAEPKPEPEDAVLEEPSELTEQQTINAFLDRIFDAADLDTLKAISTEVRQYAKPIRDAVRGTYEAKLAEVKAAEVAA